MTFWIISGLALLGAGYLVWKDRRVVAKPQAVSETGEKVKGVLAQASVILIAIAGLQFLGNIPLLDQLTGAVGFALENFDSVEEWVMGIVNFGITLFAFFRSNVSETGTSIIKMKINNTATPQGDGAKISVIEYCKTS